MPHQRTTDLSSRQFTTLLIALQTVITWRKPHEKPRKLTLNQALQITLIYHRHNLTEELLAEIFSVSQPTVSRTINLIEKVILQVLKPLNQPLSQAFNKPGSLVADQVICTLDGKLLAITDPLPGGRHDAYCFKKHSLDQFLDSSTLADKGYIGLGLVTPNKKPVGGQLSQNRQVVNREINRLRSVVERVIAQVKCWRVLHSGFRRPLGSYRRVF